MAGRNLDKARKETIGLLIAAACILFWIMILNSQLPENPTANTEYMTSLDIFLQAILGLTFLLTVLLIGLTIGRWVEASQYQKNGHYLGKDDDT